MTDQEVWVRFYAALVSGTTQPDLESRAARADTMLYEYRQRFPAPVKVDAECVAKCLSLDKSLD